MDNIATVREVQEFFGSVMCGKADAGIDDALGFFTAVMRREDLPLKTRLDAGADILRAYKAREDLPAEMMVYFVGADGMLRDSAGRVFVADDRGDYKAVGERGADAGGAGTVAYKQA